MLLDVEHLSWGCNFDGGSKCTVGVEMAEFALFVVTFVETWLLLLLMLLNGFLSVCECYVTHFTFPTCKASFADLADVRCFVDGDVTVACNLCVWWKSS